MKTILFTGFLVAAIAPAPSIASVALNDQDARLTDNDSLSEYAR